MKIGLLLYLIINSSHYFCLAFQKLYIDKLVPNDIIVFKESTHYILIMLNVPLSSIHTM